MPSAQAVCRVSHSIDDTRPWFHFFFIPVVVLINQTLLARFDAEMQANKELFCLCHNSRNFTIYFFFLPYISCCISFEWNLPYSQMRSCLDFIRAAAFVAPYSPQPDSDLPADVSTPTSACQRTLCAGLCVCAQGGRGVVAQR